MFCRAEFCGDNGDCIYLDSDYVGILIPNVVGGMQDLFDVDGLAQGSRHGRGEAPPHHEGMCSVARAELIPFAFERRANETLLHHLFGVPADAISPRGGHRGGRVGGGELVPAR